jgi:hypothetical protein
MNLPRNNADRLRFIMAIGDIDAFMRVTGLTAEDITAIARPVLGDVSIHAITLYSGIFQLLDPDAQVTSDDLYITATTVGLASVIETIDPNDTNMQGVSAIVAQHLRLNQEDLNFAEAAALLAEDYIKYDWTQTNKEAFVMRMIIAKLLAPYIAYQAAFVRAAATLVADWFGEAIKAVYEWVMLPDSKGHPLTTSDILTIGQAVLL